MGVLGERQRRSARLRQEQQLQRPHGKERAVTVAQRDAALPGENWQRGGKKCSIHQVSVGFLYTSPARVVCCVHTMPHIRLHLYWTRDGKVPITCSIMGPSVRQCQGLRDLVIYLNNEYLVSVI